MDGSKSQFAADASALGYFYQCRLALWMLLNRQRTTDEEIEVSIETVDDISFATDGHGRLVAQAKHHIDTSSRLTDLSPDLWKTIRVWCAQVKTFGIDLASTNRLLITTAATPSESACSFLKPDSQSRDVDKALQLLDAAVAVSTNKKNESGFAAFNALTTEQKKVLVSSITVLDRAPTIIDLEPKIKQELKGSVRNKFLSNLASRIEGWWYTRVVQHLAKKDNGIILGREVETQRFTLQDQFRDDNLPIDEDTLQVNEEILRQLSGKPFVEQIKLIALTDSRTQHAIRNYHRAYTQRSRWIREELLLLGDLESYENTLLEEWTTAFDRIKQNSEFQEELSETEKAVIGRSVYDWAETTPIPIRRECTASFITRGTFQILADKMALGWHPEFAARLYHLSEKVA